MPACAPGQAESIMTTASRWLEGARAVYFDAVGTLLFPAEPVANTYRAIARRHGADLDASVIRGRFLGAFVSEEESDRRAGWRTDEAREQSRWQRIVAAVLPEAADPGACFEELWHHFSQRSAWKVHPEAAPVLTELTRRGLAVGIASNFDARLLAIVRDLPELAPAESRCAVSSLVGWRKPAPAFFGELTRQAGCAPGEVLLVGDDLRNDYHGARAAGLRAVLYGAAGRSEADERIERLAELL